MNLLTLHKEHLKGETHWFDVFSAAVAAGKQEAQETWQNTPLQQKTLRELNALTTMAVSIPTVVKRQFESAWAILSSSGVEFCQELNQELRDSLQKGLFLLQELEELVTAFQQAGFPVSKKDLLQKAIQELEDLQREIFAHWHLFTAEDLEPGQAGNGADNWDLDKAFAAIAGVERDQWQQMVAARLSGKTS